MNSIFRHTFLLLLITSAALAAQQSSETATTAAEAPSRDTSYIDNNGTAHVTRLIPVPRDISPKAQLILSRGEENTGGRERASALTDAFEALLGAIFMDGGFEAAREFVLREFAGEIRELDLPAGIDNPKGELQELLQAQSPGAPEYEFIAASGPDHDRVFECAVKHAGAELARGTGKSKKAAESAAALAALEKLRAEKPASA